MNKIFGGDTVIDYEKEYINFKCHSAMRYHLSKYDPFYDNQDVLRPLHTSMPPSPIKKTLAYLKQDFPVLPA